MTKNQLSEEVRAALDRIDWSRLDIPRGVVEANPKVAEQLVAGKPTDLITYSVQIPGIPGPTEKTVRLVPRHVKDETSGELDLDPLVDYLVIDADCRVNRNKLRVVFENGLSYLLDPEDDIDLINTILETRIVTNKETGEQYKQNVCNICPEPLVMTHKDGSEQKFYLGFDSRSLRPVAISDSTLRARLLDENGHSKINHELFGRGIKVDDTMARALANGQICAAFGKGTKTGEPYATALSYNIAISQLAEDWSANGQQIRSQAYEYLKNKGMR